MYFCGNFWARLRRIARQGGLLGVLRQTDAIESAPLAAQAVDVRFPAKAAVMVAAER